MDRFARALVVSGIAAAALLSFSWPPNSAKAAEAKFDPSIRPAYTEPVVLASKDPAVPGSGTKLSTVSRMETGGSLEPSFRQVICYSRGYGVPLDMLAHFFQGPGRIRGGGNR